MAITRTTLLGGPAAATFGGHTYFARDGILVTPALEIDAVDSDAQGVLDATVTQTPVTIQFTPSAPFADLLALYPYLEGEPGQSLFGAVDSPLMLVAANGVRLTFAAAAIVQMPDLTLSTRGRAAGAVTFLALGARSLPITAGNRLVTIDTAEFPSLPTTPPQLADDFAITWGDPSGTGGTPWQKLRAMDGVKVRFTMKTSPVSSAANGLLDLTLDSLAIEVRFTPASPNGPDESDVLEALQIQGLPPGRLLSGGAEMLEIAGDHLWLRLPSAQLTRGPMMFDAVFPRIGELTFTAERAVMGTSEPAQALAMLTEGEP
jgi:hypothetical protein